MKLRKWAVVWVGVAGCASFRDDISSRDFQLSAVFTSTDPYQVLAESRDGDQRAKALARLTEPKAKGGAAADQDRAVQILTEEAVGGAQPLCRMAAIRTLGGYHDPRAPQSLAAAFESAGRLAPDTATAVQTAVIGAMGESQQPAAAAFLIRVATTPVPAESSDRDSQAARDVRLAAMRSLKAYHGSPEAAGALAQVARNERDVALRERARESYASVAGKELPPAAPRELPKTGDDITTVGHQLPR